MFRPIFFHVLCFYLHKIDHDVTFPNKATVEDKTAMEIFYVCGRVQQIYIETYRDKVNLPKLARVPYLTKDRFFYSILKQIDAYFC